MLCLPDPLFANREHVKSRPFTSLRLEALDLVQKVHLVGGHALKLVPELCPLLVERVLEGS